MKRMAPVQILNARWKTAWQEPESVVSHRAHSRAAARIVYHGTRRTDDRGTAAKHQVQLGPVDNQDGGRFLGMGRCLHGSEPRHAGDGNVIRVPLWCFSVPVITTVL